MIRLLLDAHISPAVAEQLTLGGIDAVATPHWNGGLFRTASDTELLVAAFDHRRIFVTSDLGTIPPLLIRLAERGQHHAGIILIDERTIRSNDIGGLVHAPRAELDEDFVGSWEDRVVYLRPA